jgi:hypothetical protein
MELANATGHLGNAAEATALRERVALIGAKEAASSSREERVPELETAGGAEHGYSTGI